MARLLFIVMLLSVFAARAQYAPPAEQEGSTAISADSTVFVAWANGCSLRRGWMNVADTSLGRAAFGDSLNTLGKADNAVVSLGDGGMATLFFSKSVANGNGWDFAVFENGFTDDFLELAFVEVSSDGEHFFRFDAVSNTQVDEQVETFGILNATKIHNLAGKYRAAYGVPFDLEELKENTELDVNHIIAIRVVDVVGSINNQFSTFDSRGNKINDPWPTPFETGGFDLDAVGVIHNTSTAVMEYQAQWSGDIYPNPCTTFINVKGNVNFITIFDAFGRLLSGRQTVISEKKDLSGLPDGLLLIRMESEDGRTKVVKVIKE